MTKNTKTNFVAKYLRDNSIESDASSSDIVKKLNQEYPHLFPHLAPFCAADITNARKVNDRLLSEQKRLSGDNVPAVTKIDLNLLQRFAEHFKALEKPDQERARKVLLCLADITI